MKEVSYVHAQNCIFVHLPPQISCFLNIDEEIFFIFFIGFFSNKTPEQKQYCKGAS